jgi:hypothetical protein
MIFGYNMKLFKDLNYNLVVKNYLEIKDTKVYDVENIEYSHYKNKPAMLRIKFARYTKNLDIQVGDEVSWLRGYENGDLYYRFRGFIAEIDRDTAICYDELYWINTQMCNIKFWRGPAYTEQVNGKDVTKYKMTIKDKDILENLLQDIDNLNIDNGRLSLDFRKPVVEYSFIKGNIEKGTIIRGLFNKYLYYIEPVSNTFVVETPYCRERTDLGDVEDTIMIEDNITKPIDKTIQIRYHLTDPLGNSEDVIGEYPDGVFDEVKNLYFNSVSSQEVISAVRQKYDELNFGGMVGSFTLTGLPCLFVGEVIPIAYKDKSINSKISGVDETMNSKSIRQVITLE